MEDVKKNKFFNKAKSRAREMLNNKGRLNQLYKSASEKLENIDVKHIQTSKFSQRLGVMLRLIKSYVNGSYRQVKVQNIILLIAAIIYFVMPLDLIADFIPITGFIDDFTVLLWVYQKVQEEIDEFLEWEQKNIEI